MRPSQVVPYASDHPKDDCTAACPACLDRWEWEDIRREKRRE